MRGADLGGGDYVMLDQQELESVAPGRSKSLDVKTFVDLDDIDPLYFNKAYFLGPGSGETKKIYALLRDAMAKSRKVAIASFVMRGKEYLAAVRSDGDLLVLETLFFADEVRDPGDQVENLPGRVGASPQEMRMAAQLIRAMSSPWRPSDYRDTYTDRVNELIDAKKKNEEITPASQAPQPTNVTSLVDALQASLDAAKTGGSRGTAGRTGGSAARKKGSSRSGNSPRSGSRTSGTGGRGKATRQPGTAKRSPARKGAA